MSRSLCRNRVAFGIFAIYNCQRFDKGLPTLKDTETSLYNSLMLITRDIACFTGDSEGLPLPAFKLRLILLQLGITPQRHHMVQAV